MINRQCQVIRAACLADFVSRMPLPLVDIGNMQNASVSLETMLTSLFIQTVIQKELLSCGLSYMPLLKNERLHPTGFTFTIL
jgi:hypothetical protein